jgi:hypothetical protein
MLAYQIPEIAVTKDDIETLMERAAIKSDARNHKLLDAKVRPHMCLQCLKTSWFLVTLEENEIGYLFTYVYCWHGKHDGITQRIKRQHWTDR